MSSGLNWREIDAVLAELELSGSFIRDVRQPVHQQLVFELYPPRRQRYWLLVSFAARHTRLHRLARRPGQLGSAPRFVSFMRAHVRGGRIGSAGQVGAERIVKLAVTCGGRELLVWMRLWANATNCIVTDPGGRILDALFRRPRRGEVSGGDYHPERDLKQLLAHRAQPREGSRRSAPAMRTFGSAEVTYNERIENHFAALEQQERAAREERLAARARAAAERRTRRLVQHLHRERAAAADHERLQHLGNLLLANLTRIEPGARDMLVEDYHSGAEARIELAPNLSPAANAAAYFDRAKRARRRLEAVGGRLQQAQQELAQLQATAPTGDAATGDGATAEPGPATPHAADIQRRARSDIPAAASRHGGVLALTSGAFTLLVGRTARQNDAALRAARGNDYWLHCRDYPGAHVFVRHLPANWVPLETLLDAANLALYFSKARGAGQADVYYTQVKHLRRPRTGDRTAPGAAAGRVIPTHARNLFIRLDQARIQRLLGQQR